MLNMISEMQTTNIFGKINIDMTKGDIIYEKELRKRQEERNNMSDKDDEGSDIEENDVENEWDDE